MMHKRKVSIDKYLEENKWLKGMYDCLGHSPGPTTGYTHSIEDRKKMSELRKEWWKKKKSQERLEEIDYQQHQPTSEVFVMKGTYRVKLKMYRADLADITVDERKMLGLVCVTSNPMYSDTVSVNRDTYEAALKHGIEVLLLINKNSRRSIIVPIEKFKEIIQFHDIYIGDRSGDKYWVFNFGEFDLSYTKQVDIVDTVDPEPIQSSPEQSSLKSVSIGSGPGILEILLQELDIDFHPNAKAATIYYNIMQEADLEYLAFDRKQGKILYRKSNP